MCNQANRFIRCLVWLSLCSLPTATSLAGDVSFNRDVRPIFAEHCYHCHGGDQENRQGALRLDTRAGAEQGGESEGPAIVPGKPAESALIARITSHDADTLMPPPSAKRPLSPAQIATLKQWIAEGAPYAKHWAFEVPQPAATPAGQHAVDVLVERRLAALQLQPAAPAEATTLCRRIHLDVIGLPPSPSVVEAFVHAHRERGAAATAELIERLLKTPQFGEKWARHWLDVARYSDSNGYEKDLPREQWAWRDWVIAAFNRDLPYDQFMVEQLAGDLLSNPTQDQLVATGLLRNSMVNEEGAIVPEQFRMDEMFDRLDCVGKATLGLSIQCAQCHTHKFDPITHDEYFGLFAFFNNSYEAQSWVYSADQQAQINQLKQNIQTAEDTLRKQHPQWEQELLAWEKETASKEVAWTPLKAVELGSTSGLNHPTQAADLTILTQGHPTTKGDIYGHFEVEQAGATGLRLEALTYGDLPFNGPGRSKYGTWAVSELQLWRRASATEGWSPVKLVAATADFSEPEGRLEDEWNANYDKDRKRIRGPVAFLIDGNTTTGWRGDRGPGLRNQPGVAVLQFEQPLDFPAGTQLKVALQFHHDGDDNGRHNTQLGCCRISVTNAAKPQAQPVNYAAILALQTPREQRTADQQQTVFTAWRQSLTDAEAKKFNEQIAAEWKKFPLGKTSVLRLAERERDQARQTYLLDRGAWDRPKHPVQPHVPAALHPLEVQGTPNRLDLARWLTSPKSPLAARVAVNRVWQAIFGVGLVESPEDFGTRSVAPQHQEVLDWLAVDFMNHGWSHKHLIRTILTSRTYQQASQVTPAMLERDPSNQLLTRGPRFRLEAEVLRDSALSIAGLLHLKELGGPSIFPPVPQSVLDYNYTKPTYWAPPTGPERYRRALYVFRKRSMPDPVLSSFDAPNGDFACARRQRSNTPLSALTSLNETIFVEAAQGMAQRILKEGGADDAARARFAWQLCTARAIKPAELDRVLKLLAENRDRLRRGELKAPAIAFNALTKLETLPAEASPNDIAAWTIVCRVLLNLDETMIKS